MIECIIEEGRSRMNTFSESITANVAKENVSVLQYYQRIGLKVVEENDNGRSGM